MSDFQIERDAALRGWWIDGLQEYQHKAISAMLCKSVYKKQIFIPDSLIREMGLKNIIEGKV